MNIGRGSEPSTGMGFPPNPLRAGSAFRKLLVPEVMRDFSGQKP
jgi:hypothetical protein